MQEINVSAGNFESCLKCNLCTTVCPMMAANPDYPGPKQAGPDGERYRLKDPAFYDLTLKYCLNCKRCEVACPSGVKVGDIIQIARLRHGRQNRPVRDTALASTDVVGPVASAFAGVVNPVLRSTPAKAALSVLGVAPERTLPAYSHRRFESWFRKTTTMGRSQSSVANHSVSAEQPLSSSAIPAGQRGAASFRICSQEGFSRYVSYFHGCYVEYNYPDLGRDLVTLLNVCGFGVRLLGKERCCGVALISNGMGRQAARQAGANVVSIRKALSEGSEAVLTSSSTCTFTMRDEYDHLLDIDCSDIRDGLMLATRFIYDNVASGRVRLAFRPGSDMHLAYHTACHMAKLGWAVYSIGLLKMIPSLQLDVLDQECCGIAGTFGFKKENYPYSQKIGSRLFAAIRASGAEAVVTDCETCKWQIEGSTDFRVLNPIEVLVRSLDLEETYKLNNNG